ncbi:MAG: hypothetical protein K2Z25_15635 [Beijerinckiaceae bacterium]|nr:hypothetical protein [Beijerinckiaceae bacterium]
MPASISSAEFIGIRLTDFRQDGTGTTKKSIDKVMRHQNAIGMLASGNTVFEIERAIVSVYQDVLVRGACFIAEADPENPQQHAGALGQFSRAFEKDVLRQYASDFGRMGHRGLTFEQRESEVSAEFETIRDRVLGDFKFGLAGGRRMAQRSTPQNSMVITGPISGSPIFNQGGTINQTCTRSDTGLRELADRILFELTTATAAEADARRLAEEAKAELDKARPDRSAVVKLLMRAGNGLLAIGKTALAEVTKAVVTGYAKEYGIIPPSDD